MNKKTDEIAEQPAREWFGMFIPAAVWNHPKLNCVHKCLYAEMHAIGGWRGECFASNSYLGQKVGVGENRVSVMVSELIELGLVKVVKFTGRKRWIKTLYDRDDTKAAFVKTQRQPLRKHKGSLCENTKIIGKVNSEAEKGDSADADPAGEAAAEIKPPSVHQLFMKGWCERHPDYHPDAKDGKQLKNLLLRERGVTVEFLMALLDGAVAKNGWHRKVTGTIASFCSNFNALKADVKVVTAGSDRKKLERQLEAVHLALPHVVDFVDQKEKFAEITRLERAIAGCR